ncbi:MAG: hypothetical protein ACJ79A_11270 [Gemmatimonadaceae bacterium]
MSIALGLVLIVVASYLAAHVAFEWLGHRLLIVSGAEYLLLGTLLGPQVSGIVSAELVESFAPVTALALGWMGAIIGSRLHLRQLVPVPAATYSVAFTESLITLWVVFGIELFLLRWLFDFTPARAFGPALALAAFAVATADAGITLATRRYGSEGPLCDQLRTSANVNAFVAVCTFGILLASTHPASPLLERQLTTTEWTVVSIAIGVVGGALFHLFVGGERRVDRLFVSLAGVIILVSGAATFLRLSPVLSAMFFGLILVNTSRQHEEIRAVLARVERPLYFVLLIIAGATWRPSAQGAWLLPVVVFLLARGVSKLGGARLAARLNHLLPVLGPRWGRALLGQGGLVIALAVNYLYQGALALPNLVFTIAVVSVLLTGFVSGRLASSVLAPANDAPLPKPATPHRRGEIAEAPPAAHRAAENV